MSTPILINHWMALNHADLSPCSVPIQTSSTGKQSDTMTMCSKKPERWSLLAPGIDHRVILLMISRRGCLMTELRVY